MEDAKRETEIVTTPGEPPTAALPSKWTPPKLRKHAPLRDITLATSTGNAAGSDGTGGAFVDP